MCPCKGVYRWILRKRLLQHFSNHWEKGNLVSLCATLTA